MKLKKFIFPGTKRATTNTTRYGTTTRGGPFTGQQLGLWTCSRYRHAHYSRDQPTTFAKQPASTSTTKFGIIYTSKRFFYPT